MAHISAIIIVKNGQDLIEDCLKSILFCDEIIVVDGGSEDQTVEIAKKYKTEIYSHNLQDFSEIRNLGLEKAKGKWILYIDVDERVTQQLSESIKKVTKTNNGEEFSAYKLLRKNYYLGNNEWPYIEKLERLFKKEKLNGWQGKLHESPVIEGKTGELTGFLLHYTHRDLTSMVNKTIEWSKIEAELRFNSNHPKMSWWRFPRVMTTAFLNSYVRQKGYKAGTAGLIESIYQSFSIFITYARLWEMQTKIKNQKSKIKSI